MPQNNQTPDPRFQRVLVAARALAQVDVDPLGSNVDWPRLTTGLQQLRDALADLEGKSVPPAKSTAKPPATSVPARNAERTK